ncbi:MAG: NosD domain-containing protein [Halobacteriota archaeon]
MKMRKSGAAVIKSVVLVLFLFIVLTFGSVGTASATAIYVNTSGWWIAPAQFNASSTPIQSAINNATVGDLIYVYNGSYLDNVIVNKSLTLQGENRDVVIVQANDASDHVVEVNQNRVNISGFTLIGATSYAKAGIYLSGVNTCCITDNTVNSNNCGIYLYNSFNNTIANNNASANKQYGIYLWASSDNNTLTNNTANSNEWHMGIYLYESDNNKLIRNTANYNDWEGIRLYSSDNCLIDSNEVSYNFNLTQDTGTGILSWTSRNATITNNTARHNMYGVYIHDTAYNNTVINNTASENDVHGIVIYKSSDALIYNNTANNNGYHGIFLGDSPTENITICNNTASHNIYHGILSTLFYTAAAPANLTITGNTLVDNGVGDYLGYGVYLKESSGAIVSDNYIAANAAFSYAYGIKLYSFTNASIHNNTIVNNSDYAILLDYVSGSGSGSGMMPGFAGATVADGGALQQPIVSADYAAPPTALALLSEDYESGMQPSKSNLSDLDNSPDGVNISENRIANNAGGIRLNNSDNVTITGNNVTTNGIGITLILSNGNTIYNNYFDNTNNAYDDDDAGTNVWNITPIPGTNIVGGFWSGGNYWSDYAGTDEDGDGLGDTMLPYNSSGGIQQGGDWHPLTEVAMLLPDLELIGIWVCWPANCTICYHVTNVGDGTAPAGHNTTLFVDGVEKVYDSVPVNLAPNASYTGCFNYTWAYTPPGDIITVCADSTNTIEESNETNNCLTETWKCGDVNCNEVVDMSDVIDLLYYVGYLGQYTICNEWVADVNCDKSSIDMSDVIDLLYYVGYPGQYELKCCCIEISG